MAPPTTTCCVKINEQCSFHSRTTNTSSITTKLLWLILFIHFVSLLLPSSLACPNDDCGCDQGVIPCSELNLKQVPLFYAENTTYNVINLSRNKIRALRANAFQDLSVKKIKMIGNLVTLEVHRKALKGLEDVLEVIYIRRSYVKTLPSGLFKKMKKLNDIDLSGNKLTVLPNGLFKGARNVQSVDLRHNKIMHLQAGVFAGLKKLTILRLGNNRVSVIEQSTFTGLRNLVELNLSHNNVRDLQPNTFEKVPKLAKLDLSGNQIPALFPLMLTGTTKLEELILSDNPVMWIADDAFSEMSQLKELSLSNCKLTYLKARMFRGLTSLTSLSMRGNNLTFLKDGTLSYLTSLQTLSLDDNFLRTINPCAFHDISKIKEIRVAHNKIQCTCDTKWTAQIPSQTRVLGQCVGPSRLSGQDIKEPENYERCKKRANKCPKIKRDETEENRTERKKRRRRMFSFQQ